MDREREHKDNSAMLYVEGGGDFNQLHTSTVAKRERKKTHFILLALSTGGSNIFLQAGVLTSDIPLARW